MGRFRLLLGLRFLFLIISKKGGEWMEEQLKELLKVKSLMTLGVMGIFGYMAVTRQLPTEVTTSTITAVTTYYFTKK